MFSCCSARVSRVEILTMRNNNIVTGMMDSMTDDELDSKKPIEPARAKRIARGSGTTADEVNQLLAEHKRFSKMIGKMGKLGKGGRGPDMSQVRVRVCPCVQEYGWERGGARLHGISDAP